MRLAKLKKKLGFRSSKDVAKEEKSQLVQQAEQSTALTPSPPSGSIEVVETTNEHVSIRNLWNLAYDMLREEDAELIADYEAKLQGVNPGFSLGSSLDSKLSKREQMDAVLRQKMDEVNQNTWRLKFGSTEVQVKDMVQPVLGVVNWVNDFITRAVSANPTASMAWAGVSLLVPVSRFTIRTLINN
jgi:hypothetical protein